MLEPIKHILKTKTIILASGSPRRKQIFEHNLVLVTALNFDHETLSSLFIACIQGLHVLIEPSGFAEDLNKADFPTPADYVKENSRVKALDVAKQTKTYDWYLIVGADTVVERNNVIYEKPTDYTDAFNTLKRQLVQKWSSYNLFFFVYLFVYLVNKFE